MNLIDKIEAKLIELGLAGKTEEAPAKVELEEVPVEEGVEVGNVIVGEILPTPISISYSAIGAPVMQTVDGEESVVEDGEHLIEGGTQKMVVEAGKLVKIEKVEEVEEEVVEAVEEDVAMAEETEKEKIVAEAEAKAVELETGEKVEEKVEDESEAETEETVELNTEDELSEADIQMAVKVRSALSGIDITKPGSYYISMEVNEDLEVTYAAMSSSTYENLLMAEEQKLEEKFTQLTEGFEAKLAEDKAKYENIIEGLQTGETKIKDKPETKEPVKLSKREAMKARLMEKTK